MDCVLTSDLLRVRILDKGAEICSVTNNKNIEYIWQAEKAVWPRHAPVLFPIVGKLKNNQFDFKNDVYALGQHGFARDRNFIIVESSNTSCLYELTADIESRKIYPFDFVFRIRYELNGNVLQTTYSVFNPMTEALLFSLGAHPGFKCPLIPEENFSDYFLEFEADSLEQCLLSEGLLSSEKKTLTLKNKRLYLNDWLFDQDALVFENNQINNISLCSSKSLHKITMSCERWPYFGIWSKKNCSDFVCLEPWFGVADHQNSKGEFAEKQGILQLEAKQEFKCSFSIQFV